MPESWSAITLDCDSYRLVPSHFPPIALFENLLEPDELEAAYALESLTNDRLRDEVGDIALVDPQDRVTGPGSTPIMAAFTHIGAPSRFTDGRFGVYYAGLSLKTALAESRFSRSRFFSATDEPPQVLTMRCYRCRVSGELVDVRGLAEVHTPNDFNAGQSVARKLREQDHLGILYRSVRDPGGECIAALRPNLLHAPAIQTAHYQFHWDGQSISNVFELREVE
jgi:hypothetical protein